MKKAYSLSLNDHRGTVIPVSSRLLNPSIFDKSSLNLFISVAEDKSRYNTSSFPGITFSTAVAISGTSEYIGDKKNAPPSAPMKNPTPKIKTISFLDMNGFNIAIEKTNTIIIINKIM